MIAGAALETQANTVTRLRTQFTFDKAASIKLLRRILRAANSCFLTAPPIPRCRAPKPSTKARCTAMTKTPQNRTRPAGAPQTAARPPADLSSSLLVCISRRPSAFPLSEHVASKSRPVYWRVAEAAQPRPQHAESKPARRGACSTAILA